MKTSWLLLVALALGGCAMNPTTLMESGDRYEYSSTQNPRALADCMARNLSNFGHGGMPSTVRSGATQDVVELVVPVTGDLGTLLFAQIVPNPRGSHATSWQHPNAIFGLRETATASTKGC